MNQWCFFEYAYGVGKHESQGNQIHCRLKIFVFCKDAILSAGFSEGSVQFEFSSVAVFLVSRPEEVNRPYIECIL